MSPQWPKELCKVWILRFSCLKNFAFLVQTIDTYQYMVYNKDMRIAALTASNINRPKIGYVNAHEEQNQPGDGTGGQARE